MACIGSSPASAWRSAIAIASATSRASASSSWGSTGVNSLTIRSRAKANSTGTLGRSFIGTIELHQNLQLAFGGAAPGQRQIEVALAAEHVAVVLLKSNYRP